MEQLIYKERKNSNCFKWDLLGKMYGDPELLPMWIADMDFESPECVRVAAQKLVDQGTYGYYYPFEGHTAFLRWMHDHFDADLKEGWIIRTPCVIEGMHWAISALTEPGDAIALLMPAYNHFPTIPEDTGRRLVTCDLRNENGYYTIDLEALERLFVQEHAKALIFCSPHNPVGRVWTRGELLEVLALCRKYGVILLSDEIHQDLCLHGHRNIPMITFEDYADLVVSFTSPTKTFNLAGVKGAMILTRDAGLRKKIRKVKTAVGTMGDSCFSYAMGAAAYESGGEWLKLLLAQLQENEAYIRKKLGFAGSPVVISPLEGTYLLWLDFSDELQIRDMKRFFEEECGIAPSYGTMYGDKKYERFIRLNLATSFENIKTAADRIAGKLGYE